MDATTLQQHHLQQQEQQQQLPGTPAPEARGSHISDEAQQSTPDNPTESPACCGSIAEVSKRGRGRPRGSRNKPKTPLVVPRDVDRSLAPLLPQMLEVPSGYDIAEFLPQVARARNLCIYVSSAIGAVTEVVFRNPQSGGPPLQTPAGTPPTIMLRGKYDILSISGIFLPPTVSAYNSASVGVISISVAGPQGLALGGTVVGRLVAAGTVAVVAAMINPEIQRLPLEGLISMPVSVSGSGGGDETMEQENHVYNQQQNHCLHGQQGPVPSAVVSAGMPIYRSHVVPDGLWAATALMPQPPPPGAGGSLFPF